MKIMVLTTHFRHNVDFLVPGLEQVPRNSTKSFHVATAVDRYDVEHQTCSSTENVFIEQRG